MLEVLNKIILYVDGVGKILVWSNVRLSFKCTLKFPICPETASKKNLQRISSELKGLNAHTKIREVILTDNILLRVPSSCIK